MTDEDYAAEIAQATNKPWPAPGTVRRVRVDEGPTSLELARAANTSREREGDTE
jgi:hypothetical protein